MVKKAMTDTVAAILIAEHAKLAASVPTQFVRAEQPPAAVIYGSEGSPAHYRRVHQPANLLPRLIRNHIRTLIPMIP